MRPENPKKEPVDVLREESSAAAAAQSRRPPLRPRSASKYGPMGNRKTEAESPPPPPPPQLRCLLPALRPPSASKNGPMGNRKREAESPPLPPPPQLRSLLPPLHPPSASKNGPIGQPEAGGRNPSAVAAAVEAASAAQRKGRGIVGGKSFLPPRAASASRAREPSSVGGEPPLPRRPRAPKGKKPMSAAEVVESGVIVRDKWEEMKENCIDVKETFDNQLLEREDQEDGGERYSGERPVEITNNMSGRRLQAITQEKGEVAKKTWPLLTKPMVKSKRRGTHTDLEDVLKNEGQNQKAKMEGAAKQKRKQVLERTGNSDKNSRILDPPQVNHQMGRRARRMNPRWCCLIVILLLVANIPCVTGFQRFDSIDKAADELRVQPLLRDTAMQLENEQAHARRILWWTAGAIGIALFMLAEFVGSLRQEERGGPIPPPAAEGPPAGAYADIEPRMIDIAAGAVFVIVIVVLIRFVLRRV